MPRTFTLAELRQRVWDLTDMQNDPNASTTIVNDMLSTAHAKYFAKTAKYGLGYPGMTTQSITTTGPTPDVVALPSDHAFTLRVDYQVSGSYWGELREADIREIGRFPTTASFATHFMLVGTNIQFFPPPPAGQIYRHMYVPAPAKLTSDSQTVDGVCGWEELLIFEVAIRLVGIKQQEDASLIMVERDKIETRLDEEIQMRVLTRAKRIMLRRQRRMCDPNDLEIWPYVNADDYPF